MPSIRWASTGRDDTANDVGGGGESSKDDSSGGDGESSKDDSSGGDGPGHHDVGRGDAHAKQQLGAQNQAEGTGELKREQAQALCPG
jgi:hypothetical protein